jgi:hypothetical protein
VRECRFFNAFQIGKLDHDLSGELNLCNREAERRLTVDGACKLLLQQQNKTRRFTLRNPRFVVDVDALV